MNRLMLLLPLLLMAGQSSAELRPSDKTLKGISDPTMVVQDRGAKLEVYPTRRAVAVSDPAGRIKLHHVTMTHADTPIGPRQLGVVFNHAMQQLGYISGEISFKMLPGQPVASLSATLVPGLRRVTEPDVYAVYTRTPAEFLRVLRRLQSRKDLEWVEPTITYGPNDSIATQR